MDKTAEYFNKKFAELEENNKERNNALVTKINGFVNGIKKLAARQDVLAEENENLRFELQRLRNEFNYEMGQSRASNLMFRNCKSKDDLEETLRNRVLEVLKEAKVVIECEDIISAKREGKPSPDVNVILPIKVRLSEPALKKSIFPAAKQIRISHGISIDNDYSPPQRAELYQVRCTRRALLQKGIDCFIKGFDVWINNRAYNWRAAMRYAQRLGLISQPLLQDKVPDTPTSLKRSSQGLSPLERQHRQYNKKTNQVTKVNRNFIKPPFSQQSTPDNVVRMDVNFAELFDDV